MPVVGFMGLLVCPLPLAVLGCLEGHKVMSIAELMIEATLFIAVSPLMAVYFLIGCAPVAGIIFLLSRDEFKSARKFSGAENLLITAGVSLGAKLILLVVFWLYTGRNILFPDIAQMEVILQQLYGSQPELVETARQVLVIFPYMLPSMLVIYAGVEVFLNYGLCYSLTRKISPSIKNFPPELPNFTSWRFSVSLLFASIIGFVMSYFVDAQTWLEGSMFVINLQIVVNIFMFIQGLSLAFWLMTGFKLRRSTKIFMFAILTIPFFWPWLVVMGMSDMVLNLRDRIKFKA